MIKVDYGFHKGYKEGNYVFAYGSYSIDANRSCIENPNAKREPKAIRNWWKEYPEQLEYWQKFFAKKYEGRNIDIDRLDRLQ